jgi:hypothetical protein
VTQIAHAGHYLTTIAYFVPVIVFIGWLVVTQVRDRRSRKKRDEASRNEGSGLGIEHPGMLDS